MNDKCITAKAEAHGGSLTIRKIAPVGSSGRYAVNRTRSLRNAMMLALGLVLLIAGIVFASSYVYFSSDSTFPTTSTLNVSGMTVGQSITVSTDNSNSINVNDDTPSGIGNMKVKCGSSTPAMSLPTGRIASGNADYEFELYYNTTQVLCGTTTISYYYSNGTGPRTMVITPMLLKLVKVGSTGSTASITYPTFKICSLAGVTSESSGACFTGTPTGQLVRYTPTSPSATLITNSAPAITSNGGGATAAINAAENQSAVTTVTATDGNGDTLSYSITGGADSAQFAINSGTGVLTFVAAPDFETPTDAGGNNVYDVQVTVSDGNGGTDLQDIAVTVTDVAENVAPVITSDGGGATAALPAAENQTAVTTVTATDGNGDTLSYSITGGADSAQFAINSSTGVLTFVTAPDFETPTDAGGNNVYDVQVTVSDGNGGTDLQAIAVTVTNSVEVTTVTIPAKLFLQGAYDQSTGTMRGQLRTLPDFPLTSPYGDGATISSRAILTTSQIVDWVLVEVRPVGALSNTVVISAAGLLQSDGDLVGVNGTSTLTFTLAPGNYHVAVRHRNHLGTMTASPLLLSTSTPLIDFTTMSATAGSHGQRLLNTTYLLWAGDANGDNQVIAAGPDNDLNPILATVLATPGNTNHNRNYIVVGYSRADLNLDGLTIAAGPGDDINYIYNSVFLHPANFGIAVNYVIQEQLP